MGTRKNRITGPGLAVFMIVSMVGSTSTPCGQPGLVEITLCSGQSMVGSFVGHVQGDLCFQKANGSKRLIDPRRIRRVHPRSYLVVPRCTPCHRQPEKEKKARQLIALLRSPRGETRQQAEAELLRLGDSVKSILQQTLFAADPEVRLRGARVLRRLAQRTSYMIWEKSLK